MAVQQLFTSRIRTANSSSYIGENGRMFYDEALGELRLSNGVTPGGTPITVVANVITTGSLLPTADNQYSIGTDTLRWNHLHLDSAAASIYFSANTLGMDSQGSLSYNSGTGNVAFGNITFHDTSVQSTAFTPTALYTNLVPATGNVYSLGTSLKRWGNIYIGPYSIHMADQTTGNDIEMTVNNGTLFLNGAQNLAVGNLVIQDTTLKTITPSVNMSLGDPGDTGTLFIGRQTQLKSDNFSGNSSALSINASGADLGPYPFTNTLLRVVAKVNNTARVATEAYGSGVYGAYTGRTARGNIGTPSALQSGDTIMRFSGQGYGTTAFGSVADARVDLVAAENFTDTAHGSQIDFWTTPIGSNTVMRSGSIDSTGFKGNAITFTTDSTVQTTAGIPLTQKAVANGVATLGVDGRLTSAQIPSSLVGAIVFQGGWDAANNSPTLSDGTGTAGYQYIVTIGGTRNLGHGSEVFAAGDTVTYGGNIWNHVQATAPVSSVTGNAHMNISPTVGAITVGIDATPNNSGGTVVSRDASGNFQANTITASLSGVATSATTAGTVTSAAQPSITSVGSLTSLTVVGNVSAGNVSGTNGTFTRVAGTLTTATQPNITSTGTLTGLTLSGNLNGTSVNAATVGNTGTAFTGVTLNTTGNVTAGNVIVGSLVVANNNIYSSATASDITIGQITATANVVINRTSVFNKDITANGNVTLTSGKTVTAPRYIINDGGLRTVAGGTALTLDFSADSIVLWTAPSGTATITLSNYVAGATAKVIIRVGATSRDINYGVAAVDNSTTGQTSFNGSGAGSTSIANQAFVLDYTCYDTTAANCYVQVSWQ